MLDHLNSLKFGQRLSLFGKIIKQEEERQEMEITSEPPSAEVLASNYKPIHPENEKHLETIFAHEGEEGQLI